MVCHLKLHIPLILLPQFSFPYPKAFSPLDYNLYQVSKTDLMNDFVAQGRVKELVIEWLQKHEDWTGLFEQQFSKAEAVMERFVDDEAVFHFFKRRPILL